MKESLWHLGQLLVVILGVGSIHLVTILNLNYNFPTALLFQLYAVNALLAVTGYVVIRFAYLLKSQLEGFVFLLGSFLKFGVLYMLFLANDATPLHGSKQAFLHLFIPYAICLIWEIRALVKILNRVSKKRV